MQEAARSSVADAEVGSASNVWEKLAHRLNPAYEHPEVCGGLGISGLSTARGRAYYIVKNPKSGTYVRLAPDEYFLLGLMDGRHQVKDLVLAYFFEYKTLAFGRVVHLVAQLRQYRFLTEEPRDAWGGLSEYFARRSWAGRIDRLINGFLCREIALHGIDEVVTSVYKRFGWIFFTRPAILLLGLLAAVGLVLFVRELSQAGRDPFRLGGSSAVGALALLVLSLMILSIHEAGHALATKSYGREVNRGGFMLYYGLPAFFADTTDIWLEPRRARLIVSAAGMAALWAFGGLLMLYVAFLPGSSLAPLAFQLVFAAFVNNSLNLLPLLELDGYYLLVDWLELPLLRPRALAFVRHDLLRKLKAREPFNREERIFALYGSLALICSAYVLGAAIYIWLSGFHRIFTDAWAQESPLLRALVVLVVVAVGLLLVFGVGVKLHQALHGVRGELARRRHRRKEALAEARLDARDLVGKLRFLGELNFAQREEVVKQLRSRRFRPGEYVVREGEPSDEFYLIRTGQAEVLKVDSDGWPQQLTVMRRGDYFGELALLYQQPRRASVRALTKLEVYAMARGVFEAMIAPKLRDYGLTVKLLDERAELSRMSVFCQTPPSELDPILERLTSEEFAPGSDIIRQGETGDRFYLIRRGRVQVVGRDAHGEQQVLAELAAGDYFGEMALLRDAPRAATVRALEPVALWSLDKLGFQELVLRQLRLGRALSAEVERREAIGGLAGGPAA